MLKKSFGQILLGALTHHSFTLNSQFLHGVKQKVRLSKKACGVFHIRFCVAFIKVYDSCNKKHGSFDFTTS